MKELYKSPVITVEDLTKADVLCASTETSSINQLAGTIGDLSSLL